MADDVYDVDALDWAERQADLLRRLARGEMVNDAIDWPHVIEEIEDVGLRELDAVQSPLTRAFEPLLEIACWPEAQPRAHWRAEALTFLLDARRNWAPSMRQRVDLPAQYQDAAAAILEMQIDSQPPGDFPDTCPFAVDDLIVRKPDVPSIDRLAAKILRA